MVKKLILFSVLFLFASSIQVWAQNRTITGKVTDAKDGSALPGVTILLKGTSNGTTTDPNGTYSLEVPEKGGTLVFSFIGYTSQELQIGNKSVINVKLSTSTTQLSDVVVVGYGTQVKRDLTSSVSSVSSSEIENVTLPNISNALQGKAAGVQVTGTSGVLGAPMSVRIRGASSITASSQPLYVVDGVPVVDQPLGDPYGAAMNGGVSSLINLNPEDIASIQVLKDASASAIYGSRGANGVILITTKQGVQGKTQVKLGYYGGFTQPTKKYDLLNGPEFAKMFNYAMGATFGKSNIQAYENAIFGDYLDPTKVPNTDWAKLVTQTGFTQNYKASVSGGDKNTRYYMSAHYQDQGGYIRKNELKNYDALLNVNQQVNDRLQVNLSINPSMSDDRRVPISNAVAAPYTFAALEPPVISAYDKQGELNDATISIPYNGYAAFPGTPLTNRIGTSFHSVTTQINSHATANYQIIPQHLAFNTQFSVQHLQLRENQKRSSKTTDGYPNGYGYAQNDEFLNYSWNNIATYTNNWGDHNLKVEGGVTLERNVEHFFDVEGNTFPNDKFRTLNSAANITGGSGMITSYAFQNNVLRINYAYKDRYLINLTGSYNGSSRFGSNNRYGFFPAASVGWIMTEESFMKDLHWLNFLKVRGSYGITGNGNISNFQALGLVGSGADYNGIPGLHPTQLANNDLKWEKTAQLDIGLDFHLFDSRIRGTFDYYNKQTKDLLLSVPVPATNGFRSYIKNIGKLENHGLEFSLEGDLITGRDFRLSLNGNIATLVNKVQKLPEGNDIVNGANLIREGEALGVFYLRQYAGVNPDNGDALYFLNDTPTSDQLQNKDVFKISKFGDRYVTANYNAAQRVLSGSPFPKFYGGFGTSIFYKGVQLDVNFQYQYGNKIYWDDGAFLETNMGSLFNQDRTQLNYWTPNNKNAPVPEPRALSNNGRSSSTRYLQDGTYMRLKSVIISYTLPKRLTGSYKLRLYSQGYNLLTFTGFKGLDPEITPNQGNANQGNVFFQPPQQRTITFGVDLGF